MKKLQAGPVSVGYENGFLRRIMFGQSEVIRMIYFALRDHNWNTMNGQVENEHIDAAADRFSITYDYFHFNGGQTLMEWKVKLEGRADGTIIFEINGKTDQTFRKNRAGFCVLHPLNILGGECQLLHADQSETTLQFPVTVDPENPFKNIQAMTWKTDGHPYSLKFEGDTFEMEDQRNWSDASFKTFCTPLEKPFPATLQKGDKVFQRITFKPEGAVKKSPSVPAHVMLSKGSPSVLPSFGVGASTQVDTLSEQAVFMLRELRFSHYRVDVYPARENWVADFSGQCENGFSLGLPLEVALHLSDKFEEELEAFTVICQQNRVRMKKLLLLASNGLVTSQAVIGRIPELKRQLKQVRVGAGTNYNFNEINKNRFDASHVEFISFSVDPQEHAFDDLTILENTGSQEHLVRSAKAIYGAKMPVQVSPLTLRKRFNPYATNPDDLFIEEHKKADPRQQDNLAALFVFGSVCSLAKGGASSVTLFQTAGDQGIVSVDGEPFPVCAVIKSFSVFQGRGVDVLQSSDPLSVQAILLDNAILGLANFSSARSHVRLESADFELEAGEIRFERLNGAQ